MRFLIYLILTIYSTKVLGQVFDDSQAHFNIDWKQIRAEKHTLIFPKEFSAQAPKLAAQIDRFLYQDSKDFNRPTSRISFIVQANHIEPNGFVTLAPRKSELYSTPPAIADNQEWLPNLALHESRHVAQFDNLTGKLKAPFFQQLALLLYGLHLPSWYFEGDAVLQETLYSNGGRGRLSSWNMPIRANILSGRKYDFNKYVHGSYKDIVPSFYTIGYFMTSELFEQDTLIRGKIIEDMNGKQLRLFNFQRAMKKYSGMKSNRLFATTMAHLQQAWQDSTATDMTAPFSPADRYPTDYYVPQMTIHKPNVIQHRGIWKTTPSNQMINRKLYALKESPQKTPVIVSFDLDRAMKQETEVRIGRQIMPYFHIQDHLIVWDELRKDPRFQKQTYNIIYIHDTQTNKTKALTSKTRYYTPILSPDLQTIACVEIDKGNECSLVLLNSRTGALEKQIPLPMGLQIQQPQYHSNGQKVVAIGIDERGTNLLEIDLTNQEVKPLLDWSNFQYERPSYYGDKIVFKANYDTQDDIYQLENGTISKLTNTRFGAFNPSVSNDTLWYNDYTVMGYKINSQPLDSIHAQPTLPTPARTLYSRQNSFHVDIPEKTNNDYKIENYNVTAHSLNFHSLTLSGSDFESFDNLKPGIFWLSNDVLNTTQVKLGYEYDTDIRKSIYSAEINYQRYYPKFSISYHNRGQIGQAKAGNSYIDFDWREHYLAADIQLPFSIYRRQYIYSYGLNFGTSYTQRYDVSIDPSKLTNFYTSMVLPLNYQVYLNRNHMKSSMDLQPRWGQNFSFTYRHVPFDSNQNGTAWSVRTNFYFPGLMLNHSLQIRYAFQQKSGRYLYNNDIPLPHGFSFYPTAYLKNTLLTNYWFPVAYPDWSIGSFAYIKRIRADISADYQNLESSDWAPKTAGLGASIDLNVFKYPLPIFSLGGRLTYINDSHTKQKLVPTYSISYSY